MKFCNSIRLAYFDELGEDPEIDAMISGSNYLNDWINPSGENGWSDEMAKIKKLYNAQSALKTKAYAGIFNKDFVDISSGGGFVCDLSTQHSVDFYYNTKYDFMFFIRKDDNPKIASNTELVDKIKISLSKMLEQGGIVNQGRISIKDAEEGKI
jgi:hypothetical protein